MEADVGTLRFRRHLKGTRVTHLFIYDRLLFPFSARGHFLQLGPVKHLTQRPPWSRVHDTQLIPRSAAERLLKLVRLIQRLQVCGA